jgi:hypothetical protein
MKKLVYYIIPLVVLVLVAVWQFGPSGLLEGVKDAMGVIVAIAPNVTVGSDELGAEKLMLPKEHEDAIKKLVETMEKMKNSGEEGCFAKYGVLPNLGEKGTVISLEEDEIEISRGGQIVEDLTKELRGKMKGFKLCVIAGKKNNKNVAEEFYNKFLEVDGEIHEDYFLLINDLTIASEGDRNIIKYGETFHDFEDGGWLFTPDGKHICFFPTYESPSFLEVCYGHEQGLDNNCFSGEGEHSVNHVGPYFLC